MKFENIKKEKELKKKTDEENYFKELEVKARLTEKLLQEIRFESEKFDRERDEKEKMVK